MSPFDDLTWIEENLTETEPPLSVVRELRVESTAHDGVPIRDLVERPHLVLPLERTRLSVKKTKRPTRYRRSAPSPPPEAA